jgi:hypothetical protein
MKRAFLPILALAALVGCATPGMDEVVARKQAERYQAALELLKADKWTEALAELERLEADLIRNNEGGRFDDLLEHVAETLEEVADHLAAD